jgi:hypothetical protein
MFEIIQNIIGVAVFLFFFIGGLAFLIFNFRDLGRHDDRTNKPSRFL